MLEISEWEDLPKTKQFSKEIAPFIKMFYGHFYKPCILSLNIPQTPRKFSHCLCSPSSLSTPVSSRHNVIRRRWFPLVLIAPQLETEDEY